MILWQIFHLSFMTLCSFIQELYAKDENINAGSFFNFEHQYMYLGRARNRIVDVRPSVCHFAIFGSNYHKQGLIDTKI